MPRAADSAAESGSNCHSYPVDPHYSDPRSFALWPVDGHPFDPKSFDQQPLSLNDERQLGRHHQRQFRRYDQCQLGRYYERQLGGRGGWWRWRHYDKFLEFDHDLIFLFEFFIDIERGWIHYEQ